MTKRVNVVVVRVQSTDLEVSDDFVLTAEGLRDEPDALLTLNLRRDEDTISSSVHIQLLEEEEAL